MKFYIAGVGPEILFDGWYFLRKSSAISRIVLYGKYGFNGEIKLEFHGAKVTSKGGLLVYRDLDDALGLFDSLVAIFMKIVEAMISNIDKKLFTGILSRIERLRCCSV